MGRGRDVLAGGGKRPLLRPRPSLMHRSKPKEAARRLRAGAEVRLAVPAAFKCTGGGCAQVGALPRVKGTEGVPKGRRGVGGASWGRTRHPLTL